jgi:hypothetical protein
VRAARRARCGSRALTCGGDRRSNSFSLIHEARPQALEEEQYTQALFAAAVSLLGRTPDSAQAGGVDANDAGVLYALLLLFRTQHCAPRVHVYLPLGARPVAVRCDARADAAASRGPRGSQGEAAAAPGEAGD